MSAACLRQVGEVLVSDDSGATTGHAQLVKRRERQLHLRLDSNCPQDPSIQHAALTAPGRLDEPGRDLDLPVAAEPTRRRALHGHRLAE